jgi:NADPH-dependent 2,4-dienoyl-CoA reductase/sulfur reductase-like enzyme
LGKEWELDYSKVDEPKSVLIVGGGPGGLEAARTAAIKGHKVSLYEKRSFLGGQFRSAAYPPCKGELSTYIAWITNELNKLGVKVYLNSEVTNELVDEKNPDVIIIATGGAPLMPPIKGIDKPHVISAEDALLGNTATGDKIVIAGGGEVGGETAAHLAMQQKDVSVVEMCPSLFRELDGVNKYNIMKILDEYGVKKYTETKVVEILDEGVVVENSRGKFTISADTVVIGLGYRPNNKLAEELKESHDNVVVIAGAVKTSNALAATREGFDAGISIK